MRRVPFVPLLLAALLCASSQATPILNGTFNIAGNITVSNPGFAGCPLATQCISWTDPPSTAMNKADISASGLSGVFAAIPGFSGNDQANVFDLRNPPAVVDGAGFPPQLFTSFNAPGITTTLLINFIAAGIYSPVACGDPPAVGQVCTLPGSLFNFVNNPGAPGGPPQATASAVFSGVTNDGQSTWFANYTSQFGVPFQTVFTTLNTFGSVNNSYSATFTVTTNIPVPEAGTMALLSLGLVLFSVFSRRKTRKVSNYVSSN